MAQIKVEAISRRERSVSLLPRSWASAASRRTSSRTSS